MSPPSKKTIFPVIALNAPSALAQQIRDMILAGAYASGDLLPTEREMVEKSALSRSSVREALKILETEGLIVTKAGRAGGARVSSPTRARLAQSTEIFIRSNSISLQSLIDCRITIEPMLARLAARSRSDSELENLRRLHQQFCDSLEEVSLYRHANYEWHLAIAAISRNEPLHALLEAISKPIFDALDSVSAPSVERRHQTVKEHADIMRQIEATNEDGAAKAMEAHLKPYFVELAETVKQ